MRFPIAKSSVDKHKKAAVIFEPSEERVVIGRHNVYTGDSGVHMDINDDPEVAPHTLFSMRNPSSQAIEQETLDIRLFFDTSVLEVFINERVAITTRVYPESGKCFGVRPFVKYGDEVTEIDRARVMELVGWEIQPSVNWT